MTASHTVPARWRATNSTRCLRPPRSLPSGSRTEPGGVVHDHELVTVMVPAHNESGFLAACLASIRAQDYPDLQIVVVDSASTDSTADIVRRHQQEDERIELVQVDRTGIPLALNRGLARARGRWLVRVDATRRCRRPTCDGGPRLQEGRWAGVGGRKDGVGRTPAGRAVAVAMSSRLAVGNSTYHFGTRARRSTTCPSAPTRWRWSARLGGWDEAPGCQRGLRVRLPAASQRWSPALRPRPRPHHRLALPPVDRGPVPAVREIGRGKVDVAVLHPGSMGPRHIAPPCSSPTSRQRLPSACVALVLPGPCSRRTPRPSSPSRYGSRRAWIGLLSRCASPRRSRRCTWAGDSASGPGSGVAHRYYATNASREA